MLRSRSLSLIACALYGVSLLLPIHELFVEEAERCAECVETAGAVVEKDCGSSPCEDPSHHHHHRCHHDTCPACSHGKVACPAPGRSLPALVWERVAHLLSSVSSPAALVFASGHPARGPPTAS